MTFSAVGLGDVQGVRNFSRFPTLGHPFYLAHRWTTRQVRGTFDDQGAFSFSPSTDIPSVPAGTFTAGWCPATDRENGKRQKERKREWEREREGKRREREGEGKRRERGGEGKRRERERERERKRKKEENKEKKEENLLHHPPSRRVSQI